MLNWIKDNYEALSVLSALSGALATFLAAAIALWLGLRPSRPRGKLDVGFRVLISDQYRADVLSIKTTNRGDIPLNIVNVGWEFRRPFKWSRPWRWGWRQAIVTTDDNSPYGRIPRVVAAHSGDTILLEGVECQKHIRAMSEIEDLADSWLSRRSFRFGVYFDTEYSFKARPDSSYFKTLDDTRKEAGTEEQV
jgi:hypothetical protein